MSELKIKEFCKEVGENNEKHGFRESILKPTDFVALIHSEVSEILEEFLETEEKQLKHITEKMGNQKEFRQN